MWFITMAEYRSILEVLQAWGISSESVRVQTLSQNKRIMKNVMKILKYNTVFLYQHSTPPSKQTTNVLCNAHVWGNWRLQREPLSNTQGMNRSWKWTGDLRGNSCWILTHSHSLIPMSLQLLSKIARKMVESRKWSLFWWSLDSLVHLLGW
jgi:hypothetical protein